jgi:glycosyltransferase A (GT-A) superfamily protein (DUF2064 family)
VIRYSAEAEPVLLRAIFREHWALVPQGAGGLSRRLTEAAVEALERSWSVVICGTDAPLLQRCHIDDARSALQDVPLVLCPARDGGFSLIGLRPPARPAELFEEIPWSTAETRARILARADDLGLGWQLLPQVDDVDEPEDLEGLALSLDDWPRHTAPRTRAWLTTWRQR